MASVVLSVADGARPTVDAAGRVILPFIRSVVEARSFTRAIPSREPSTSAEAKAGSIYQIRFGIFVEGDYDLRPTLKSYLKGLIVERVEVVSGELTAFVSVRGSDNFKLEGQIIEIIARGGTWSGDVDAGTPEITQRPTVVPKVVIPTPVRTSRPAGSAPMSDEEKQRLFMGEGDVQATTRAAPAEVVPVTTAKLDANMNVVGRGEIPASRVGAVRDNGLVDK